MLGGNRINPDGTLSVLLSGLTRPPPSVRLVFIGRECLPRAYDELGMALAVASGLALDTDSIRALT